MIDECVTDRRSPINDGSICKSNNVFEIACHDKILYFSSILWPNKYIKKSILYDPYDLYIISKIYIINTECITLIVCPSNFIELYHFLPHCPCYVFYTYSLRKMSNVRHCYVDFSLSDLNFCPGIYNRFDFGFLFSFSFLVVISNSISRSVISSYS